MKVCDLPKVDDGSIYPETQKFFRDGEFLFDYQRLPTIFEMENMVYTKFEKVATTVLNIKENFPKSARKFIDGPNYKGKLVDYIPEAECEKSWKIKDIEWVYAITYNDHIVKIGKTAAGLSSRFGSYCTGTRANMSKKSPATTNFVISESNYLALRCGLSVDIYAYRIPQKWIDIKIFGQSRRVLCEVSHKYEEVFIDKYKNHYGMIPPLCGQQGKIRDE